MDQNTSNRAWQSQQLLWHFADFLTLIYHEGRNVRHLVRHGYVSETSKYQRLINLPTNRYEAWTALQAFRQAAAACATATEAERVFRGRLGLSLEEMVELFSNSSWRHARFGGNKWVDVTREVVNLRQKIDSAAVEANSQVERILLLPHNTGSIKRKLRDLDAYSVQQQSA